MSGPIPTVARLFINLRPASPLVDYSLCFPLSASVRSALDASAEATGTRPPTVVVFHGATDQRAVSVAAQIAPSPDGLMPPLGQTKPPSTRLGVISYRELMCVGTWTSLTPCGIARSSTPGDTHRLALLCIPEISSLGYEHDASGFPAASSMHGLSGRVISQRFSLRGRLGETWQCRTVLWSI